MSRAPGALQVAPPAFPVPAPDRVRAASCRRRSPARSSVTSCASRLARRRPPDGREDRRPAVRRSGQGGRPRGDQGPARRGRELRVRGVRRQRGRSTCARAIPIPASHLEGAREGRLHPLRGRRGSARQRFRVPRRRAAAPALRARPLCEPATGQAVRRSPVTAATRGAAARSTC